MLTLIVIGFLPISNILYIIIIYFSVACLFHLFNFSSIILPLPHQKSIKISTLRF